ncbi:putative GBF-interacting protein [Tanacetum coccineum]
MSNGVPISSKKMIQSLKEIVNGVPDAEIYATLKDCNMDPNEAVNRLLSQDTFHEVKSKREKKKEVRTWKHSVSLLSIILSYANLGLGFKPRRGGFPSGAKKEWGLSSKAKFRVLHTAQLDVTSKDTTEFRPRGGSSSNRGGRSGTDRYAGRSSSTHYSSSESGGVYGKPAYKRENGASSYTASATPAPRAAPRTTNWNTPTFRGENFLTPLEFLLSLYSLLPTLDSHQPSTYSTTDAVTVAQSSSGYQSAWSGAPGQKSMADIVKMGRPQNKAYATPNPSQQSISHNHVPEYNASPDNDWPSIEPSQPAVHTHADWGLNSGQSNLPFDRSNQYVGYETNEAEPQHESSSEDHIEDHDHDVPVSNEPLYEHDVPAPVPAEPLYDHSSYRTMDSYHPQDDASEQKEAEEVDAPISSVSENIQKLSIQEEEHVEQPEDDVIPSVVIPDHLQVHTADLSHLSFGSFGANLNAGFSGTSSVEQPETTNREYYDDASPTRTLESDLVQRTGAESYDLPSVSQGAVLNQDVSEVTHSSQYGFPPATHVHTYDNPQLLNSSFPQSQTPPETQISTPFLNAMQAADTNSLLAANGHPTRESDLSYSQFSVSQSMPTRYANSVSSINDPTISMAEALKSVGLSSSQPGQQTLPTGPSIQQHLAMHPYAQHSHPLGPYANMMSYPFLPQSYTYMPSGFQPGFAGNTTYHQQLAAMLPQYKNSVSMSSLTQSPAAASGYGSYGGSTALPGSYQVSQPAGPAGSYDDVLNAHFKDTSHLLSLQQQQQNENSQLWVHGGGSRTMPAVPASAYYNLQSQNQQQPSGFRQGQQPSQSYGGAAHNYPDFFQSQTGISQEHQLQQNPRDGSHVGGSQGQPKLQSQQQLWQNAGY